MEPGAGVGVNEIPPTVGVGPWDGEGVGVAVGVRVVSIGVAVGVLVGVLVVSEGDGVFVGV